METVHKHVPVMKDRPTIIQPRVDNVFSVDLRNPNSGQLRPGGGSPEAVGQQMQK